MKKKRLATKGRPARKVATITRLMSAARTRSMVGYDDVRVDVIALLEGARHAAARSAA